MLTKLALFLLKRAKLGTTDRSRLITACLDKLHATPLRDIITYDRQGSMLLNGQLVELEQARVLRDSARAALNSKALQIVKESVKYQSFCIATTKAETDNDLLFGKAAIWFCQEHEKLLDLLAGDDEVRQEIN